MRPEFAEDITEYTERMMHYVRNQFGYDGGTTNVHSTVDDILTLGGGVCQDFAHLRMACSVWRKFRRDISLAISPPIQPGAAPPELATNAGSSAFAGHRMDRFYFDASDSDDDTPYTSAVGRDYDDLPPVSGVYVSAGGTRQMAYELEVSQAGEDELEGVK